MLALWLLAGCMQDAPISGSRGDDSGVVDTAVVDTGALDTAAPCEPVDAPEGAFLAWDTPITASHAACERPVHAVGGPEGARLRLELGGAEALGGAVVEWFDWNGDVLGWSAVPPDGVVRLTMPWSGEVGVRLVPPTPGPGSYAITARCVDGCDAAWTRHPIVLMHGMAGDDAWLDRLDYFYGVADALTEAGYAVAVPAVDPLQRVEVRSEQWRAQLDDLRATGRMRGFNLVGHSQGGLDARYIAAALDPEGQVRSVLTIGTPHRGSEGADFAVGLIDGAGFAEPAVDLVGDAFGAWMGVDSDQDLAGQLEDLSTPAAAAFNATVPDRPDVLYASWAGRTCAVLDLPCIAGNGGETVLPLFAPVQAVMQVLVGDNDGLVAVESAKWGEFRGVVPADHGDEVGQVAGLTAPGFDHLALYLGEAAWLAERGL